MPKKVFFFQVILFCLDFCINWVKVVIYLIHCMLIMLDNPVFMAYTCKKEVKEICFYCIYSSVSSRRLFVLSYLANAPCNVYVHDLAISDTEWCLSFSSYMEWEY